MADLSRRAFFRAAAAGAGAGIELAAEGSFVRRVYSFIWAPPARKVHPLEAAIRQATARMRAPAQVAPKIIYVSPGALKSFSDFLKEAYPADAIRLVDMTSPFFRVISRG